MTWNWNEPKRGRPERLYRWQDLYGDGSSECFQWDKTLDFAAFRDLRRDAGQPTSQHFRVRSIHDAYIGEALLRALQGKRVVSIMGGHRMARDSAAYADVVALTGRLTREGFLVMSGGGPGAMEAAHFGALTAHLDDQLRDQWLDRLKKHSSFPHDAIRLQEWLTQAQPSQQTESEIADVTREVSEWLQPALQIMQEAEALPQQQRIQLGESLSIPTWHYGHEPFTPFATDIARMFQNSVREDNLLAYARHGVVYFGGGAGTIQEVFQEAAQNYYGAFPERSPMVFMNPRRSDGTVEEHYWTQASSWLHEERRPVFPLLKELFQSAPKDTQDYARQFIRPVNSVDEAVAVIQAYAQMVRP